MTSGVSNFDSSATRSPRLEHLLASAKYSFDSSPESSTRFGRAGARHKHRNICAIQNAARQIAHDVVAKQSPRLRCAGHDQIVIALARFFENLIDHDPVPKMHFSGNTQPFELSFLPAQIVPSSDFDSSS